MEADSEGKITDIPNSKLIQQTLERYVFQSTSETSESKITWQSDKVPDSKRKRNTESPGDKENIKKSAPDKIYALETKNRFAPLSDENADDEESLPTPKPEPIFVTGVNKIQDLIQTLDTKITKENYLITTMKTGHMVKIMPSNVDTYKVIRNFFVEKEINHYTYQLKHEKAYRVVMRGMHHSVDTTDIIKELEALGHTVRNITNARHRQTKEPLPIFYIDLEPKPNNKKIFDVKHLNRTIITFEAPYVKKEIVQCKRCQRFGHTKNFCYRPYRCVKCGENHATAICTKRRDTPATCVNCNQQHPANYRGCRLYKDYKQQVFDPNKRKQIIPKETGTMPQTNPSSLPNASGRTYAEMVTQSHPIESTKTQQSQPDIKTQHSQPDLIQAMKQMFEQFERTIERMMDKMFDLILSIVNKK